MPSEFSVATYNILADVYIKPQYFPDVDPALFLPTDRHPRLISHIVAFDADVVCLQEVTQDSFAEIDARLSTLGYQGRWAQKGVGKPDGCATFVRAPWTVAEQGVLHYADGGDTGKDSGHVAQLTTIERDGAKFLVANTHIKWDNVEAPFLEHVRVAQAMELLQVLAGQSLPTVICGDFNAEPHSDLLELFRAAGFSDSHADDVATFNQGGVPRKIDYVLHDGKLDAQPHPSAAFGVVPLPNDTEPSDHKALLATFRSN